MSDILTETKPDTVDGTAGAPLLALEGVTKAFPGVVANDAVSLAVRPGEIHALLGENGAGKSTLVKIIYGILQPDAGTVRWRGEPIAITGPAAARRLGIGMVFQHFSLFEALTVAENIELALPPERDGGISRDVLPERIRTVSEEYGLPLDPRRTVHDLSVGERQRIEIVRCLLQKPRLLIMDEPTSVLTPQEADRLFSTLRRLRREGCAILYISHKLDEIRTLCDTATILRNGKWVAECDPRERSVRELAHLMIGETPLTPDRRTRTADTPRTRLQVSGLSLASTHAFGTTLQDVSFSVAEGEVLGIAGVAGNGQTELMEALIGETLCDADAIRIDDRPVGGIGPRRRRALGACYVPEERNGHATAPDMNLADNGLLSADRRMGLAVGGWIRPRLRDGFAAGVIARFGVKAGGAGDAAKSLSGGNLQKFSVGREIAQEPEHSGDQPADLGCRCGVRGGDPARDPRSGGEGSRGRDHLAGSG